MYRFPISKRVPKNRVISYVSISFQARANLSVSYGFDGSEEK